MSLTVQTGIPSVFTQGDAVSFKVTDALYPAPTWTSKVVFKDQSGGIKTFDGAASGTSHLFALTNAQSGTLVSGQNLVCLQFSDGTNRQSSDWTDTEVLPDPSLSEGPSYAQQQVTALQGVITKLQSSQFQTVNFNGQSYTENSLPEVQKQLTYWEARLIQEQKKNRSKRGLHNCRSVSPAFVNDGNCGILPASTLAQ